jgi:hypothetical protein
MRTLIGLESINNTSDANFNTLGGNLAGASLSGGVGNTAFGSRSLFSITTNAQHNTSIGRGSGELVTGNFNTCVGRNAGGKITTGSNNTFLGNEAGNDASQSAGINNSTAIGNGAFTTLTNQTVIGSTANTYTIIRGATSIEESLSVRYGVAIADLAGANAGLGQWLIYKNSGGIDNPLYIRDLIHSRQHVYIFAGANASSAVTVFDSRVDVTGNLNLSSGISLGVRTIATLPSAASSSGQRYLVTDSSSVARRMVFSDGSAWYYEGTAVAV